MDRHQLLYPFTVTVSPCALLAPCTYIPKGLECPGYIYTHTHCTVPRATALCPILTPKVTGGLCSLHSRGKPFLHRSLCHRMSDVNRLAVPTLLRGLCVVVKPCNPKPKPMPSLHRNSLSMAIKAPPMPPAVPDRRVDVTVSGPRRVAIISGPTGSRRCRRYGTLQSGGSSFAHRGLGSARPTVRPGQASHGSYSSKAISKARRGAAEKKRGTFFVRWPELQGFAWEPTGRFQATQVCADG
jgi:hypothetical protein